MTRVDLPDPDTPVTQVNTPRGNRTVSSLVVLAHPDQLQPALPGLRRLDGTAMARFPAMYWPVRDASVRSRSARAPSATIWPPCSPAPGPMSTR